MMHVGHAQKASVEYIHYGCWGKVLIGPMKIPFFFFFFQAENVLLGVGESFRFSLLLTDNLHLQVDRLCSHG